MGFLSKLFGSKKTINRKEIEEELKYSDLSMLRGSLIAMMQIAAQEGKEQGGAYYMEPNMHKAMMKFINNPCLETAVALVQINPSMLSLIKDMNKTKVDMDKKIIEAFEKPSK
jgi:hypothetical protein